MPSTLPAGFVLDQEGPPEGFVLDQPAPPTQATPAPAAIERPSSFLRRAVGDTAVDLGKGVVGVGEAAVGLGNLVSGGYVGKGLEAIGYDPQTTKKMLEEGYTHERVAANKAVSDAKGFVGTTKALIQNPSALIGTAVESAPLMLGGGAVARGGAALLGRAGSIATPGIRGAAAAIPHTTAGRIGLAAAGEGLVGAGAAAEGIRQQSDDGLLSAKQTGAALASGAGTAALGALGGKVAQKIGIADVDVALAGGAKAASAKPKNILRRTVEGMVSEGLLEELPQSMQEQMWQNVALDKPLMEGVPEAAAAGALAGGLMGGGFSAISRPDVRPSQNVGTSEPSTDTSEQDPFASSDIQPDTSEPLSGVAAPLSGDIPIQPQTPAAQMAANMRMEAQIQRANAKTVLGRAAADATEMQADAVAADPFDLSDMGATPNDEAPADGFTRLGVIAQSLNLDPEAIVAAARADVGDDPRYSLDGLDDRILTIYAQSLAPTVQPAQAQDGFPSEGAGGSQPTPVQAPSVEAQSGQANPVEGGGLAVESPVVAGDEPALASIPAAGAQAQEVSTASNAYPQEGAETRAIAAPEQPEYDESEDILDSDITTPSGTPFTIRDAAERAAARHEGGRVFPVDGGFVVRVPSPQASSSGQSEAPQPVPGSREQGALAGQAQAAPAPAALPVQEDRAQDAQAVPGSGLAAAQTADSSPSPQATPAQDSPQARQAAREANVPADLLAKRDAATERLNAASAAMQQFPAGNMGLTPDAVKAAPEWKAAKIELDRATVAARNANAAVVKASKAKPAKAAPPAASGGIDEAAVRAAYNAAMQAKTGVTDFDYGRGTFGDLIVGALNRDPEVVESARSSLINGSNETGLRVFFQQAGMKMPRTQREQRAAFDAYIGVSKEDRAASDKAKADSKQAKREQEIAARRDRKPIPDFKDAREADAWWRKRAEAFPSQGAYRATPEYAEFVAKVAPLYEKAKTDAQASRSEAMEKAGVKPGDRVQSNYMGEMLTSMTFTGRVVMRGGAPWVKLDEKMTVRKNRRISDVQSVRWTPDWTKVEAEQPATPAPQAAATPDAIQKKADEVMEIVREGGLNLTRDQVVSLIEQKGIGAADKTIEGFRASRAKQAADIAKYEAAKEKAKKPRSQMTAKELREAEAAKAKQPATSQYVKYDEAAKAYGRSVREDGAILKDGKESGLFVREKGKRLRIEDKDGKLTFSGAPNGEALGKFMESFWFAEKVKAKPEQPAPTADRGGGKNEAKPDPADTKANTEDAGEELWANRRNSTGKGLQWADIQDLNPTLKAREAVKSKVWPRPNYEQLVEGGIPAPMARIIKSVYDAIATKPQTSKAPTDADYQAYIAGVQKVRDAAFAWARAAMEEAPAADNKDVLEFGEKHGLAAKDVAALVGVMLKRGGDGSMLDAVFPYDEWADRSRFRGRTPRSTANNDLALLLGGRKLTGAMQVIPQDIMAAIRDVQKGWPSPQEAWEKSYTIHEDKVGDRKFRNGQTITITEPSFWIASKQGRFNLIVAEGFKTREEAAAAAKALYEKKRKKGGDGAKSEAPVDLKDTREGPQRRQANEDITSDKLKDTFGFKGVNFGNWMKGASKAKMAERQAHLNNAYDSMLDLAEILNIPPKAIGLNGMLGLAIGAQGSGGRAAAHFVPGVNEINLTRAQGAGSLAHEWAHALDHYFATLAGGRVATGRTPFLSEHTADKHDGVRPEVQEAFKAIVKAMRGRDMTPEEVAAQERAMLESAKRSLERSLAFMRDGLANGTLKTGTGRSRENVLATFDELATRLRNGDLGEGYLKHGKGFNDSEPQVVAMLAMLYRESLGYKYQEIPALGYNARRVAESGNAKQSNATHIPQVPSNFRREAIKLDKGSTGKYWSSTLEMFARSFQSYVLDRLAAQGARNDYLTRPQMDEATLKVAQEMGIGEDGDRYPRGDERNAINRGFDTLVASLRTRETDGGNVALENVEDSATEWLSYMEADESRTGGDFDADRLGLRGAVNALLGKSGLRVEYLRGYAGLPDDLRNAVESRNAMGRKGQTAALYDPVTQRVFVFTHVVRTPERAAWNAAHEIAGHDGLRKLLGKRLDEVLELAGKNPTVSALADEIAVQRKLRGDQRLLAVEEALAELAAAVRTGDYGRIQEKYRITVPEGIRARIQQVVENFIRRLKELLQNRTGVVFKDADVRALLEHAWQAAQVDSAIGTPESALESAEDGPFGPIYESHDFEAGIDALLRNKTGEIKDGMFHPSIGYVDVVYGETGSKARNYEDGYGLAKIAAKYPEVYLHNLADELSRAPNPTIRGNTATFDTPTYTMVVKRDWKGDPKNWLLTAFEPKSAVSGNTRIGAAAAGAEARSGQDTAAADSSMASTEGQTQGNPSILESVEDFTLSDNPAPQDARIPGEIRLDPLHKVGWKGALRRLGQKFTDLKPAALALVPLQEMDDFTPKDADGNTLQPAVRHYIQLQNAMQAMRNGMYVQYDKTAQDLHAYSTAGSGIRGFFGKAVNKQGRDLFALMHDSTIAGIDPSEENVRYKEPEKAAKYRELQERFSALPDEGKRLFNEVRDAYAKQTDLLDEVIEANAMRAAEIATNRARRKLEERERDIEEDAGLSRAEKAKAKAAARKSFDDAVNEGGVQSKIMALRSMLEANRVPKPYFPLKRYGKFWVSVLKDGKLEGFSKFESAAEQEAFSRQMVAQGYQTRLKYQDDAVQSREMIDPKFVAEVEEILTGLPDQVRDDVWQAYLERMPDMSLRKSFIHRKNVPGYHFDALKAFGSSMFHGSYQIARLKYGMEMQEAIDVAKEQANALRERDSGKALAADMVAGELDKRHAFIMNPTNAQWAQKVNGAAFLYSLGANPAHLFLNATQTVMIGVPVLGSRYGFRRASAALGKAAQDFAKGRGHLDKSDLTQDEKRAFREMQASGIIEKTQAHDIAGIGSEGVEYNAVRKKVMDKIGWFMHQSERFNREVTAIAAYRLARSAGKTHDAALAEASKRVYEIHFDYSNAARARIMQGDVAKALLVFRNYQTNMLYRLFRDIHQSIRGESVQVKREARRQLGAIFGMYGLFAGTMGVPFYGLAMALAGAFDDDDDPVTAEQQFVNGTVEFLGPTAAKVLLRGLPGTLFDVDLTERIGLGNLWFRSPQQEMEGRDAYYYWMEQLLGAGVSPVKGVFDGINLAMRGQIQRGIERAAPAALRNPLQAIRQAQEGGVTSLDGDLIKAVSGGDIVTKALGFTALSVAEQYEKNSQIKGADRRLSNRRQRLMNRYFLAIQMGDDTTEALADIHAFSLKNPEYAITRDTLRRSAKARARNSLNSENGIVMTRRMRRLRERMEEGGED